MFPSAVSSPDASLHMLRLASWPLCLMLFGQSVLCQPSSGATPFLCPLHTQLSSISVNTPSFRISSLYVHFLLPLPKTQMGYNPFPCLPIASCVLFTPKHKCFSACLSLSSCLVANANSCLPNNVLSHA